MSTSFPSIPGPKAPLPGQYIYAIAAGSPERRYDVTGIDGAPVHAVAKGPVAAIVSACVRRKIRPERAHLAAHQQVLRRLMLERTVLPMAFGIIADDLKA
ncbi:MAG: GvpL/GvpF family gas vesicle protein, partial [Dehalococcoidia bacterium]